MYRNTSPQVREFRCLCKSDTGNHCNVQQVHKLILDEFICRRSQINRQDRDGGCLWWDFYVMQLSGCHTCCVFEKSLIDKNRDKTCLVWVMWMIRYSRQPTSLSRFQMH